MSHQRTTKYCFQYVFKETSYAVSCKERCSKLSQKLLTLSFSPIKKMNDLVSFNNTNHNYAKLFYIMDPFIKLSQIVKKLGG